MKLLLFLRQYTQPAIVMVETITVSKAIETTVTAAMIRMVVGSKASGCWLLLAMVPCSRVVARGIK